MNNDFLSMGGTCVNVGNIIIGFLRLGALIAGLVVAIMNRRLSKSMVLVIVGFAGEIGVWVLPQLIGQMYGLTSIGREMILVLNFFNMVINLLGPISIGLLVWGLFLVFQDVSRRRGRGGDRPARRRDEDDDEDDDRPAPRPKKPGSRDIER